MTIEYNEGEEPIENLDAVVYVCECGGTGYIFNGEDSLRVGVAAAETHDQAHLKKLTITIYQFTADDHINPETFQPQSIDR